MRWTSIRVNLITTEPWSPEPWNHGFYMGSHPQMAELFSELFWFTQINDNMVICYIKMHIIWIYNERYHWYHLDMIGGCVWKWGKPQYGNFYGDWEGARRPSDLVISMGHACNKPRNCCINTITVLVTSYLSCGTVYVIIKGLLGW